MRTLPKDYTPEQAYVDIIFLALKVKELEEFIDTMWTNLKIEDELRASTEKRIEEIEQKYEGFLRNYAENYPLIKELQKKKKKSRYD